MDKGISLYSLIIEYVTERLPNLEVAMKGVAILEPDLVIIIGLIYIG